MNKNKKNIASICLSLLLLGQLSLAEETQESEKYLLAQQNQQVQASVTSAFQNVNTSNPVQHISNEVVTPVPSFDNAINHQGNISTTSPLPTDGGFKETLMSKVDEKFAKLDDIERRMSEQQLQNQLNQSNMNFGGGSSMGGASLSVPVVIGTTIIERGKKVVSKGVLAVDSQGNKFNLNEKNNNVIKSINNDYIVFKDSKDKFPLLISNSMASAENGAIGGSSMSVGGFPNSMFEVPNSIKIKAESSSSVGSLQDSNVSNTLR